MTASGFPLGPIRVMLGAMSGELERGPGPGALPDPDTVVIPDDPGLLEADLWAWRAEQARLRRHRGPARSTSRTVALRVGPMLLGALLLVAYLASLATTVRPAVVQGLTPAELAQTSVPDGEPGGLLPTGIVDVDGATQPSRALRPAALVLVPATGSSLRLLESVHLQALAYGIATAVVGPPERRALLAQTAEQVGAGTLPVVVDRASVIAESLGLPARAETTVVIVGVDGRIHAVLDNPSDGVQLQSVLSRAAAGADPAAARS